MQQRHPKLTKEISLSEQKKSQPQHTYPKQSTFHCNQCYMFITILEVLTDQQKPKL